MTSKIKVDPVTGSVKQQLPMAILGGLILHGVFASFAIFYPSYSKLALYIALPTAIIGIVLIAWMNQKPNLWTKFFVFLSLTLLWTIGAIRSLGYLFGFLSPFLELIVMLTILAANILPYLSLKTTKLIKTEISDSPKSPVGKFLLRMSIAIIPIAGVLGTSIGMYSKRFGDKEDIAVGLLVGVLCWILAVMLPFSSNHPISPWDRARQ